MNKSLFSSVNLFILLSIRIHTFWNVFVSFRKIYYRRRGNIFVSNFLQIFPRNVWQYGCRTGGTQDKGMQDITNAWQEGCRTWWMHNRRGAGHEECMTGGVQPQDMRNALQVGYRAKGMHDWRDAGREECMTWGVQDMRNSKGRGPTSQHLKVTVPCGSAIFKGEGASGGPLHTQFICKKVKIDGKQPWQKTFVTQFVSEEEEESCANFQFYLASKTADVNVSFFSRFLRPRKINPLFRLDFINNKTVSFVNVYILILIRPYTVFNVFVLLWFWFFLNL